MYILDSQSVPVNPAAQAQVKPPIWSTHVPMFLQGRDAHSSISVKIEKIIYKINVSH